MATPEGRFPFFRQDLISSYQFLAPNSPGVDRNAETLSFALRKTNSLFLLPPGGLSRETDATHPRSIFDPYQDMVRLTDSRSRDFNLP